jgi:hypothetical protein
VLNNDEQHDDEITLDELDPATEIDTKFLTEERTWVTWSEYGGDDEIEFLRGRRWA